MWNDLTQEQRRGFNWLAKQRNRDSVDNRINWTGQEVALEFLQARGTELYAILSGSKLDKFKPKFAAMTAAQQAAFLQQHQLTDDE